jgi:hypothetical protein
MSRARKKKEEMSGNSLGVLSSGALAGAERSGGERSEPQRSAAPAKASAGEVLVSRPDSEVVAKAKRRSFTAEYKLRILQGLLWCYMHSIVFIRKSSFSASTFR